MTEQSACTASGNSASDTMAATSQQFLKGALQEMRRKFLRRASLLLTGRTTNEREGGGEIFRDEGSHPRSMPSG